MKDPKVSVIITTRNRLCLLKKAIDSVLSQTYKNIELIVVSDNSSDGTDEYCKSLNNITFVPLKSGVGGGNVARNMGIEISSGEYIAFLDDDDYWCIDKIEKQINLALSRNSYCVYCLRYYVNAQTNEVSKETEVFCLEGDLSSRVFRHYLTSTSCLLVKRSILIDVGCFDVNIPKWQEYELMIRLSLVTPIYYVKEALVYYLNDSSDKNRISNQPERLRIAVKYIFKKYKYRLLRLSPIDFYLFLDTIAIEFLGKMKKHTLCYFLTTIFVAVNFKIKKIGKWKEYRIVNQ